MAKNLVNGTNIVIKESGDNISMDLSSSYNTNLQQKIDESVNKNILTAFLTSQQTTSQSFGKINLDSKVSVGDKLTLNDNGIKIGAGVTKVKVSAGVSTTWNSPVSNDFNLFITKNGTTESNIVIKINGAKPSTNYGGSVMLSEQLIEVKENDVLYLCLYGTINSLIYDFNRATYMTVEVVE